MIVELFQDPPAAPAPSGMERRRSRRHAIIVAATLTRCDAPDEKTEVEVRDISLHGAGIRASIPLAVGDLFLIDIGAGPLKVHARLRIANCRAARRGDYVIGAAFC